jgi:hypothetical protein
MWIYISGLLCLWIQLSSGQTKLLTWLKNGLWLGVPALLSLAVIYVVYLSKGENPASLSGGFKLSFEAFGFPVASPLLAGFSVDDILNGLIYNISGKPYTYTYAIIILAVLVVLSILLMAALIRYLPHNDYRLFIVVFYGMAILFFGYSFLRQAAISYESRHVRIIGLLIIPGIIYLLSSSKLPYRLVFMLMCVIIIYKSCQYLIYFPGTNKKAAHGISGISQQFIDQKSLNYILDLDKQKTNALFVFISADIGLEIRHNRIITLDPYDASVAEADRTPYMGHAGTIYMVLPANYAKKELAVMYKYFPGYKDFTTTPLSKDYTLYTAQ